MTTSTTLAEIAWIVREARALIAENVLEDSPRWQEYLERKQAALAAAEAAR